MEIHVEQRGGYGSIAQEMLLNDGFSSRAGVSVEAYTKASRDQRNWEEEEEENQPYFCKNSNGECSEKRELFKQVECVIYFV